MCDIDKFFGGVRFGCGDWGGGDAGGTQCGEEGDDGRRRIYRQIKLIARPFLGKTYDSDSEARMLEVVVPGSAASVLQVRKEGLRIIVVAAFFPFRKQVSGRVQIIVAVLACFFLSLPLSPSLSSLIATFTQLTLPDVETAEQPLIVLYDSYTFILPLLVLPSQPPPPRMFATRSKHWYPFAIAQPCLSQLSRRFKKS